VTRADLEFFFARKAQISRSFGAPTARTDAVAAANAIQAERDDVLYQLKQLLQIQAGAGVSILSDYRLTPRKTKGTTSPKVKVDDAERPRRPASRETPKGRRPS
jgi:hypothetical protein